MTVLNQVLWFKVWSFPTFLCQCSCNAASRQENMSAPPTEEWSAHPFDTTASMLENWIGLGPQLHAAVLWLPVISCPSQPTGLCIFTDIMHLPTYNLQCNTIVSVSCLDVHPGPEMHLLPICRHVPQPEREPQKRNLLLCMDFHDRIKVLVFYKVRASGGISCTTQKPALSLWILIWSDHFRKMVQW